MTIPLSILDLAPIGTGMTATESLAHSRELARLADGLGYTRYWFAEHHGMPSIASSAPEILIANIAAATERMRIGSGGIMMQNHVPLKLAEAFHTLEALYPGRIDLGIGRAPGTDPATSRALRPFHPEQFREQMLELLALSGGTLPTGHPFEKVKVIPSGVALPPIWMLGSSGGSAALAGQLGLGYSFASHFSKSPPAPAIRAYRESFQPNERRSEPHVILAVSAICAETDEEADYIASTGDLVWVRIRRGEFQPLPSPEEARAYSYSPEEMAVARGYRQLQYIGTPDDLRARIDKAVEEAGADEVMISSMIHGHQARVKSYELLAEAFELS